MVQGNDAGKEETVREANRREHVHVMPRDTAPRSKPDEARTRAAAQGTQEAVERQRMVSEA